MGETREKLEKMLKKIVITFKLCLKVEDPLEELWKNLGESEEN